MKGNFSTVLKGITKKSLVPFYLLHGKEPYFTSLLTERIIELAVPVTEKSFNEHIYFGKDVTIGDIVNLARRYPMMAERQLVVIKNAEGIIDINQKEATQLLEKYLENPLISTVLVMHFNDAVDERKTWVKLANKMGFIFKSTPLYDNELPDFVVNYCQSKGAKINLKANHLLIEHTGNDLPKLVQEIDKVLLNVQLTETIEESHVERFVGISKDYNVFELQRALGKKDFKHSYKIVKYLTDNAKKHPIQPLIILLFNFYSKLLLLKYAAGKSETDLCRILDVRPYFLSEYKMAASNYNIKQVVNAIHAIKKADLHSKGIDSTSTSGDFTLRDLLTGIFV